MTNQSLIKLLRKAADTIQSEFETPSNREPELAKKLRSAADFLSKKEDNYCQCTWQMYFNGGPCGVCGKTRDHTHYKGLEPQPKDEVEKPCSQCLHPNRKGICTCGRGWNLLNHDYNSQPKNRQEEHE